MLASIALCLIELIDYQRLTAELPGWFVVEASVCLCCTRELPLSPHRVFATGKPASTMLSGHTMFSFPGGRGCLMCDSWVVWLQA